MTDTPSLQRTLRDPWLTRRLSAAESLTRAELAINDAVLAAYARALAVLWRVAMDEPGSIVAAGTPDAGAALEAARTEWREALAEFLEPILSVILGDRWRGVYDAVIRRVPQTEVARYVHLATVPNRLVERYWAEVLERIGRSVDDVFDDFRVELADALSRGETVDEVRDRVARVLQIDAGSREIRERIRAIEAELFNVQLSPAERGDLIRERTGLLHDLFVAEGRQAVARAKMRLAEALQRRATQLGRDHEDRDELLRRAAEARAEAARVNPAASLIERLRARLAAIDARLYRNPELDDDTYDALRSRRGELYEELRTSEHGWHYRARRIARSESIGALNGGTVESAKSLGEATGVTLYKTWLATHDERVRASHQVADGQQVPITDPFSVGGSLLMFPGDPTGPAHEVIHCRCSITLEDADEVEAYDSLAAGLETPMDTTLTVPEQHQRADNLPPLVVDAARNAPLEPPAEWFSDPSLPGPTPITVTREGRVLGHVAQWDACHAAYQGVCVSPPRSASGYAYYHYGSVITSSGEVLRVGKLTVGGGHASQDADLRAAIEHYDDVSTAVAVVRAGEDDHGPWVAGAIRPGATPEQIYDLLTSPLSGDWRQPPGGGGLELVAAHAVNVPGFGIRASAGYREGAGQVSLVAAGALDPDPALSLDPGILDRRARVEELTASLGRDPRSRMDAIAVSIGRDPASRVAQLAESLGL